MQHGSLNQTCAASHQVKSDQSNDFDLTFFIIFSFYFLCFDSKKGPDSPKMCQSVKYQLNIIWELKQNVKMCFPEALLKKFKL
jgi:hypothetical protein